MPHVYMSTSSPGSNGTTAWRAVSYSRIGGRPVSVPSLSMAVPGQSPAGAADASATGSGFGGARIAADARQLRRDARLVAHVELQQDRGERLDGRGVRQLTGVERTTARDLGDDLADRLDGFGVVPADQHVRVDRLAEVSELLGRQVVQRGDDVTSRHRSLDVGGHAAPRRHERLELVTDSDERVRHRDDDLALERRGVLLRRRRRRIPRRRDDHELAVGGRGVVAVRELRLELGRLLGQVVDRFHRPVLRPGPDHDLVPDAREPGAEAAASGARPAEDADAHEARAYAGDPATDALHRNGRSPRDRTLPPSLGARPLPSRSWVSSRARTSWSRACSPTRRSPTPSPASPRTRAPP